MMANMFRRHNYCATLAYEFNIAGPQNYDGEQSQNGLNYILLDHLSD